MTNVPGKLPTSSRVLAGLMQYVCRYKARVFLAFVLSILGVIVELLRPWPIQIVVDYVLLDRTRPRWLAALTHWLPMADSREGMLVWSVCLAILVGVVSAALSWFALSVTVVVAQRLVYDLGMDLFAKLQRLSLSYHARHPLGDLLQRVNQDVFVAYFVVANVALPITVSLLTILGMFVILAQLNIGLTLLTMSIVPLLAITLIAFFKPMDMTTARQYETQGAVMALMEQSLSAVRIVQGFARESFVQAKLERRAQAMAGAYGKAARVSYGYGVISGAITGSASALVLGFGAMRVMDDRLTVGELLVFISYLTSLFGPVNQLTTGIGMTVQLVSRGRRVFEILDAEEEVREHSGATELRRARGEVVFERVSFGYGDEHGEDDSGLILRDISFKAHPGQITAIVGATGAGKTSLVGLLSRFYDPTQGHVLIDGHDVRGLTLRSLRENVSLVLQEPFLFPISAADNIAFGRPNASREEIVETAKLAQAHEFIADLPEGYDTVLGEKGASLSGGERQRIAIARALLKDAAILIMDEPTSALDAYTESKIFEALSQLMRNRTTLVISHRLSTIRGADQILALEDGRIVECGTHEELLARGQIYSQLYRHQHIAAV